MKAPLLDFLQVLLNDSAEQYFNIIRWQDRFGGIFKIIDPPGLAQLWGYHKRIAGMTYDKMSRSLRNYYKTNKLRRVAGQRQVYQFIYSKHNPPHDVRVPSIQKQPQKHFPVKNLKKISDELYPVEEEVQEEDVDNDGMNLPLEIDIKEEYCETNLPLEVDIKEEYLRE